MYDQLSKSKIEEYRMVHGEVEYVDMYWNTNSASNILDLN